MQTTANAITSIGRPALLEDQDFKTLRTRWVPAPLISAPGDQYMAIYIEDESLVDA